MLITREFEFAMGHTLRDHPGKCRRLHGHNYRLLVTVDGEIDRDTGMVIDFGDLKTVVNDILDAHCDHRFMIWRDDPRASRLHSTDPDGVIVMHFQPTAENIAAWLHREIEEALPDGIMLSEIELWETANCYVRT